MADAILQFLIGCALGCGIMAYIIALIYAKKHDRLETKVNKLDEQVNKLINACNDNTKHIDELLLASAETMKIVAEHIDTIKELKKGGN